MAICTEKVKDKATGKMVDKKVDGKIQYYIRTYVKDEFGKKKQITRHNKEWLGRDGYWKAQQEENRLKSNFVYKEEKEQKEKLEDITFKELFYLKLQNDELYNKNSKATRITYEQKMTSHVFPIIGDKIIYQLKKKNFDDLLIHLKTYIIEKGTHKGENLKFDFINGIILVTKSVISFGVTFYNLDANLLKFINPIQENRDIIQKPDPLELINKKTILSPSDWKKIAKAMENTINEGKENEKLFLTKMMLFFTTEYILLTRVGETQGLKYSNLLFDYSIYSLYEAWNKRTKSLTPTKNRKARILYIPTSLLNAFRNLYSIDSKRDDFSLDEFIFGSSKVFPRSTIDRYRKALLEKAGVNYLTNHELRHAGISNAMHNEVDASALSDMAGHDKEIMYKIYVQTLKESNSDLIKTLDKLYVPKF